MEPDDPAHAGQRHYTTAFLRIYDPARARTVLQVDLALSQP